MLENFNLQKTLEFLKTDFNIPDDVLPKDIICLESKEIIDAINKGLELSYDEDEDILYYINENGDKLICPDLSEGLSVSADWVSNYLPPVVFDIDQGGNTRKSLEVESIYKIICLCHCIKTFKDPFIENLKNYDFNTMANKDGTPGITMNMFVQNLQNLNSVRISSILSAASIRLSNYREKNESYYTGQLSPEEISALEALRRSIKAIISKYEREQGLNPSEMKRMTKLTKLRKIEERDVEIEKEINKSSVEVIYRITKFSSERIPVVKKAKVYSKADAFADDYVKNNNLSGIESFDAKKKIKERVITESFRAIVKTIRSNEIQKYKNDRVNYKIKVKA